MTVSQISSCGNMVDARFMSTIETFGSFNAAVLATTRYVQPAPYGVVGPLLRPGRIVTSTTSAEADVAEQMAALAQRAAATTVVRAIRESVIPAGRFYLGGCYRQTDRMRALHVLLAGFGFLLGFLIIVVSGLIEWASFASRTDFAFVGDSAVSVGVSNEAIYTAIAAPLVGALLGWVSAVIATRFGWSLTRGGATPASE